MSTITQAEISAGYRVLLGRSPDVAEIDVHVKFGYPDLASFFKHFVACDEFLQRFM